LWAQPIGDSHDSQLRPPPDRLLTSPMTRSSQVPPRTPTAIPLAAPAPLVSWAATAPTAANAQPAAASWSPAATDPATGRFWPAMAAATSAARTRLAARVTTSAAARAAWRPTTVAPSSSRRPDSSSVRVWRMTVSMAIRAISTG
jgi:hypothetical protein